MPGNDVGDRIHNFFGQENLTQDPHQSQIVDSSWAGPTNNHWAGTQRQISLPLISNLKSHNLPQSAHYGGQSASSQHGMNFAPSSQRLDFVNSEAQGQQPTLSGYMQGHQLLQTRQNEANILGVNAESNQLNITSKSFSSFESQLGNGPELHKKATGRMDFPESPINYDFFGGQQQMSSQNPGLLQSLPRQHSGVSDMQLLQQQLMLKQMQEMLRHQQLQKQQFQQQEARQLNSIDRVSTFAKQAASTHSMPLINGTPIHDGSNYSWQPDIMAANTNWTQRGSSPVIQGPFSGLMFSPEQGQAPSMSGMVQQNVDQSLYGVPVSGTRVTSSRYSPVPMDKSQQTSGNGNSFAGHEYAGFQGQVSVRDETLISRQGYNGGDNIGATDSQGLNSGFALEHIQQTNSQQGTGPAQEFHERQGLAGPSDALQDEAAAHVAPSQHVATLDPTEEKILFGSDDNLWDAFGSGANMSSGGYNSLDSVDVFGGFPSIQSGSWSALMQSAVAETSGGDTGVREEWSGLTGHNNEPPTANQQAPTISDSGQQQSSWIDSGLQTTSTVNNRPLPRLDGPNASMNFSNTLGVQHSGDKTSYEHSEQLQTGSQLINQRFLGDGPKWPDRSFQRKEVSQGLEGQGQVYIEQSQFAHPLAKSSTEIEKGRFSGFQGDTKVFDQLASAPVDEAVRNQAPDKATTSSQNMLELIHKVDQSREHGSATHFSSSNCNQSSEMLEPENSDGSVHLQPNQSSDSRGENAHSWLAPVSSIQSLPLSHETSQRQPRNKVSGALGQPSNDAQRNLSPAIPSSFSFLRNQFASQSIFDRGGQASANQPASSSADGFASLSKQMEALQRAQNNQSTVGLVPDTSKSDSRLPVSSAEASLNYASGSAQQFPVLEAAAVPMPYTTRAMSQDDASKNVPTTVWPNVSPQQRSFSSQPLDALSNMLKPNLPSNNNPDTTFSHPLKVVGQNVQRAIGPSESGASPVNSHVFGNEKLVEGDPFPPRSPKNDSSQKAMIASHENEHVPNHLSAASPVNNSSTQKEIEAFGRSLRPDNILHQNFSLLHQVQGMRNTEVDPSNRSLKRLRGSDGASDARQAASLRETRLHGRNNMVRDGSMNRASMTSGDSNMLNFSAKPTGDRVANELPQDMLAFGQSDSQTFTRSNSVISIRGEHSQISPQMASAWFHHQFGTVKNGQILPMYDARKVTTGKTTEMSFPAGRPDSICSSIEQANAVDADAIAEKCSIPSPENQIFPTTQLSCLDAAAANLGVTRPKKRKSATSELVPWHKEVMQAPQRLQSVSVMEVEWAKATNRLIEKVESETEMVDDVRPVLKSKRRLILTRQLMQLLLSPPPIPVLFADSIASYESAVYFVAKSTLGDSCNAASCFGRHSPLPSDSGNLLGEKPKALDKISEQYISKVIEALINRGRKLEHDLLRLDKRASVLDLRVECQDLEKFSVINRFAKFHGRGQAESAETSSAPDTFSSSHKSLQRYVTAVPMPKNLPDWVQCLSL